MMESEFIFSGLIQQTTRRLLRRQWWRIFSHDKLIEGSAWVRKSIILNKAETDAIMQLDTSHPLRSAFLKAFAGGGPTNVKELQLEEMYRPTQYIKTSAA